MSKFIYSYNKFSEGAKALAETMGIKRIKHGNSRFRPGANKTVINWGCGGERFPLELGFCRVLNHPANVLICTNKKSFFEFITLPDDVPLPRIPEFTTDTAIAKQWHDQGIVVVARQKLSGHSAEGLYIMDPRAPEWAADGLLKWYDAPLYTKYVKKKHEFRVHIVAGEVIDVQRKAKKHDFDEANRDTRIRNLANGYIYAREGFVTPDDVIEQAKRAFVCSGLDFGAIDVIYNERENQAYVLEINTAPGLTGTTLTKYAEALGAL